jgi:hypothetical protein
MLHHVMQVLAHNTINPANLTVNFTSSSTLEVSPAIKSHLRAAWKPAVIPAYTDWALAVPAPLGWLENLVTFDRMGAVRTSDNNMPGAML